MTAEMVGVVIGGVIGVSGSLFTAIAIRAWEDRRRRISITRIATAEVTAIRDKCRRYIEEQSSLDEFKGSTPLWASLAHEIGYLPPVAAVAARQAVTLDMEVRRSGNREKAQECIKICEEALALLSGTR